MRNTANFIRLSKALLLSKLAYRNLGPVPYPFRVNIAVTYHCNMRCNICNIWRMYRKSPNLAQDEMTIEDYSSLFEALSPRLFWLGLTGGEPFLREDLADIVRLAFVRIPRLHILELTTNGFSSRIIGKVVNEILETNKAPFLTLGVSMDGPPSLHDNTRGVSGSWNRALATYRKLSQLSEAYPNFSPHISYTISRHNAGNIDKFIEVMAKEEIPISALSIALEHTGHLYHTRNKIASGLYKAFVNGAKADIISLLNKTNRLDSRNNSIVNTGRKIFRKMYLASALKFLENPRELIMPCAALIGSCFIDPFGNIYPCSIYGRDVGNAKKEDICSIWHSKSAYSLRQDIKQGKCPNCWSPCEAEPSFLVNAPEVLLSAFDMHALGIFPNPVHFLKDGRHAP